MSTRVLRRSVRLALMLALSAGCQPSRSSSESPPVHRHGYTPAAATRELRFPADHGPHRDTAVEWWYFTGHVSAGSAGEVAGFEVTVFRLSPSAGPLAAAPAAGRPDQASFLSLHVAVTDSVGRTFRHKTLGLRERTGVAFIDASPEQPLRIVVPGASVALAADGRSFTLAAELRDENDQPLAVHATLASEKPVTLHGAGGYSRKGQCPSCASHYASFPRLRGTATVRSVSGERSGAAQVWFDHEFGGEMFATGLSGWDWMALQLDDGWELMAVQVRGANGQPGHRLGTLISPQGQATALAATELSFTPRGTWTSPHSGAVYPARWQLTVTNALHPVSAELVPKLADQELSGEDSTLATYWEGTCELRVGGRPAGLSYLEMTGYDPRHAPRL